MLIEKLNYKELVSDIFLFEEVVSKDISKQILEIIEKYPNWRNAEIGKDATVDKSYRSNKVDYLTSRYGYNADVYYAHNTLGYYTKKVIEKINDMYANHTENYMSSLFSNITSDEGFQILKYEEGEEYKLHTDASSENKRVLSMIIYLNNNYEGGETTFTRQNLKVKGKTGDILTFPSNYCFPHKAEKIISGTKYVMVTWFV